MMQAGGSSALRIDPDDFRDHFPEYTGRNSSLFQRGVTSFVERTLDLVYQQRQSFLLDGTLANLELARRNIGRALNKDNRSVQIIYVYQRPELAWEFVLAREKRKEETFLVQSLSDSSMLPRHLFVRLSVNSKLFCR